MIYDMASYRSQKNNQIESISTEKQPGNTLVEFNSFQFLNQLPHHNSEYHRLKDEQTSLLMRIKNILYKVNPDLFDKYLWYEVEQSRISLAVAYERGLTDGQNRSAKAY